MGKELIQDEDYHYKCDNCGDHTEEGVVTIQFGYGSNLDGEDLAFCSDKCFKSYVGRLIKSTDSFPKSELNEHSETKLNKEGK